MGKYTEVANKMYKDIQERKKQKERDINSVIITNMYRCRARVNRRKNYDKGYM